MADTDDVFTDRMQTAPRDEVDNLKHVSCGGVFNRQNSVVDLAALQCREHVIEYSRAACSPKDPATP